MDRTLTWDERKREANLAKHGLDFANAGLVLESDIRLDVLVIRNSEERIQSFAYVFDRLAVLSLVHVPQDTVIRIVSFRTASKEEREAYHEWLTHDFS